MSKKTDRLLTASEVALLFKVDPHSPSRWRRKNQVEGIPTGHKSFRYRASELLPYLEPFLGGSTDIFTIGALLTPGEVAALFGVNPKTAARWATTGKLGSILTPGGQHRFLESEVRTRLANPA